MFSIAAEKGYHGIAFGHHLDDIAETLLMNMMHHGNISTMSPRVSLFKGTMKIIRPLSYVLEEETRAYASAMTFVPPKCRCQGDLLSVRRDTKQLLSEIEKQIPSVRDNLFQVLKTRETGE